KRRSTAAGATPEEGLKNGAIRGGTGVARVSITGSSDGLGLMAARLLIDQGHEVVLHGRNDGRSRDALAAAAGAGGVVSGGLSTVAGARTLSRRSTSSVASTL